MATSRRPGGAATAAVVAAAVATVIINPTAASAAPQPDYPTWQDVQNARKSEAAKQAEVTHIEGILVQLEAQAAELGKVAQLKSEQYAQAQDALATATKKVDSLKSQASEAQDRAD